MPEPAIVVRPLIGPGQAGAALIDIVVALTLVVVMTAIAVPVIGGTMDREHTIVGTQYLAGQLQRARLEALKRARSVSSMRRRNCPPVFCARARLKTAM